MTRPLTISPLLAGAFVALASLSSACSRGSAGQAPQNMPPPKVEYELALGKSVQEELELTGRLAATDFVEVRPRISGHVREVRFQAGQIVEKDAVLFVIDPRWQEAEVARAEAHSQSATSQLAVAEKELARAESLVASRAISSEELEARSGRVLAARAAVASAKAALLTAKLDLEFTEIKAPIRGRVSRPLVTVGNHVSGTAGMTTILTTLVSIDPVHFYADLDEASYLRFQATWSQAQTRKQRVPLRLALGDEKVPSHAGEVESLDNQLDVKSGTIVLRGLFANPNQTLIPGLYGRALLPIGAPRDAVLVSERAINTDQNQRFVLVVNEGNTAEYRRVRLGGVFEGKREVLEGVKPGERVVVAGHAAKVRPGSPVTPELATTKTPGESAR